MGYLRAIESRRRAFRRNVVYHTGGKPQLTIQSYDLVSGNWAHCSTFSARIYLDAACLTQVASRCQGGFAVSNFVCAVIRVRCWSSKAQA